jgi:hypothetical protein
MKNAEDVFIAEDAGPPRRRFWIARDAWSDLNDVVRGWSFVYDEFVEGDWVVGWDTWEERFFEIIRYPPEYQSQPLIWRREADGTVVDLNKLQIVFDGPAGLGQS